MRIKTYNTATSDIITYETSSVNLRDFSKEIGIDFQGKRIVIRENQTVLESLDTPFPTGFDLLTLFIGPNGKIGSGLSDNFDFAETLIGMRDAINEIFNETIEDVVASVDDEDDDVVEGGFADEAKSLGF